MNEIKKQVAKARWRLNVGFFGRSLVLWLTAGLAIGCVAFALPRMLVFDWVQGTQELMQWQLAWSLGAVGLGLLGAAIYSWTRRTEIDQAALEVDERFNLKERISSALTLGADDANTPAGRSLMADATERAQRIDVRDQFPFKPTKRAWLPIIPALVMVGLCFVPTRQPETEINEVTSVSVDKEAIQTAIEQTKKLIEEQQKRLSEKGLDKAAEDLKAMARELDKFDATNEDLKKETMVKLNDLKQQFEKERNEIGDPEALKKEFSKLSDLKPGEGKEIADALKEGDFEKAKNIVKDLAEKMKDGKLTEVERQNLAENLNDLAKSVDEMAKKHEEDKAKLQEEIKQAVKEGDPQKAAELQEQLDKKQQQDKQIQKMKDMAENLKKCSDCMNPGKGQGKPKDQKDGQPNQDQKGGGDKEKKNPNGQPGDQNSKQAQDDAQKALDDLAEQLEQLETDQETMDALKDMEDELQECKDGMNGGGNDGKPQRKKGDFQNGKGQGHGLRDEEETDTGTFKTRVKATLQKGQTIVAGEADGENRAGTSVIEAREVIRNAMSKESDPMKEQQLPKAKREQARQYFEKMRKGN